MDKKKIKAMVHIDLNKASTAYSIQPILCIAEFGYFQRSPSMAAKRWLTLKLELVKINLKIRIKKTHHYFIMFQKSPAGRL